MKRKASEVAADVEKVSALLDGAALDPVHGLLAMLAREDLAKACKLLDEVAKWLRK